MNISFKNFLYKIIFIDYLSSKFFLSRKKNNRNYRGWKISRDEEKFPKANILSKGKI